MHRVQTSSIGTCSRSRVLQIIINNFDRVNVSFISKAYIVCNVSQTVHDATCLQGGSVSTIYITTLMQNTTDNW